MEKEVKKYDNKNTGVLFPNNKNGNDKAPDMKGKGNFDGVEFDIAVWNRVAQSGKTFVSVKFSEPYIKPGTIPVAESNQFKDDLPF